MRTGRVNKNREWGLPAVQEVHTVALNDEACFPTAQAVQVEAVVAAANLP